MEVPTGNPATSLPPLITSSMASSSATLMGGWYSDKLFPRTIKAAFLVLRAKVAAIMLGEVVLLGPLLAAAMIGLRTVRISVKRDVGTVTASLTVAPSRTAVLIVGLSVVILGIMGVYLAAENLSCIAGQRVSC